MPVASNYFDIPRLIINLIPETGGIDNSQGYAGTLLIQFELCDR